MVTELNSLVSTKDIADTLWKSINVILSTVVLVVKTSMYEIKKHYQKEKVMVDILYLLMEKETEEVKRQTAGLLKSAIGPTQWIFKHMDLQVHTN